MLAFRRTTGCCERAQTIIGVPTKAGRTQYVQVGKFFHNGNCLPLST